MEEFGDQQDILQHALTQAIARAQSHHMAEKMGDANAPARNTQEAAKAWVALGLSMLAGGKISATEAVIFLTFSVEGVHFKRLTDGEYSEIELISRQMRTVEREAGLREDQYWQITEAPEDYRRLSDAYDAAADKRFEATLREFELETLADLWRDDRSEYNRLREIGRRAIFHRDDHLTAISASIPVYEDEAIKSASAGAFYAAAVMLGSAAEARLLERFLNYPQKTAEALGHLPRTEKPRNSDPLHWNLGHMLAVAEQAGWLGVIEDDDVGANVKPWLLSVRDTRNLLHPGRHARDKPHATIGSEEYVDAKFGYGALCIALQRSSPAEQIEQQVDETG